MIKVITYGSYDMFHYGHRRLLERAKALGIKKLKIGIVDENVRLRKWYESFGFIHTGSVKFDFFPFTCGYMERDI